MLNEHNVDVILIMEGNNSAIYAADDIEFVLDDYD